MRRAKRTETLFILFSVAACGVSFFFAQGVGQGRYSLWDSLALFRVPFLSPSERTILFAIRLPRILLAFLVGGGLSLSGAVLQGIFQNPLVDPYILGVSSGAAFGAVVAILSGVYFGLFTVPIFAFVSALGTVFFVFRLARVGRRMPLEVLLLAGLAVGFFFSALISLGMFLSGENLHQVVFWTMGGFWGRGWGNVWMVLPFFAVGVTVLLPFGRELNAFILGEKVAESLGIDVERTKRLMLSLVALLVASCVATSGVIGFVGLVVPHILRLLGFQDHRKLLPLSLGVGGVVLLFADTLARSIIHPVELPVGVVTSLLGVPFFVYLLRQRKRSL
ncbi:MAG: iron ABC transporter permease [Candidatus Caldatribacterium sp.]|nr:iron ABC transporter permease [Candidatus Caldatribacterium sp.]